MFVFSKKLKENFGTKFDGGVKTKLSSIKSGKWLS